MTHRSRFLGSQLCVKDLIAENLLANALRISSCGERTSEQRRKMPRGLSILWSYGSVMALQWCYDYNTSLGPFSLPVIKQSFSTGYHRGGLTLYRARWFFSWEQGNGEGAWTETDATLPSQHLGGTTQQVLTNELWSQEISYLLSKIVEVQVHDPLDVSSGPQTGG